MVSSRSCCSGLTIVKLMVSSWSVQGHVFWFDHGQIDGHFMVSGRSCCPGLTMVDHGQIKVMLFWVDHGRPWFDHGQIVISWSVQGHVVLG